MSSNYVAESRNSHSSCTQASTAAFVTIYDFQLFIAEVFFHFVRKTLKNVNNYFSSGFFRGWAGENLCIFEGNFNVNLAELLNFLRKFSSIFSLILPPTLNFLSNSTKLNNKNVATQEKKQTKISNFFPQAFFCRSKLEHEKKIKQI